ncbi:MIT domain-containing protein 1 [Bulinus truncatus]|nr:MIT domain-containing protein 1 [Bulinus truncatus]
MADGTETSTIDLLKRAVDLDTNKRYEESLTCYQEDVGLLMKVPKNITEELKRQKYRQKIEEYLKRAEELKDNLKEAKEASKKVEQIQIESDSTGHSYKSLFGQYLNNFVTAVEVEDPYYGKIIKLDTGWVVKIGRGLDYFKPCERFNLGFCYLDLRPSHETTVDIFHQGSLCAATGEIEFFPCK